MFPATAPPARLFAAYSPAPLDDVAVPPFPGREADDEDELDPQERDLDFELPEHAWQAIAPTTPPADAPVRFVDGSIQSRTAGLITVGYRRRPLVAAVISAASLEIEDRSLKRGAGTRTRKLLCLSSNGIDADELAAARASLAELGVELRASEAEDTGDFDHLRRSARSIAMEAMEEAEKEVMLAGAERPTLVDGLLERRLRGERPDLPVVGLVKRQIATYLPAGLQELAYSLKPGERTPAFVLTTQDIDLVNVYVRLSAPAGASPSYGIVRVTVPLAYLRRAHGGAATSDYLSGLAGYLYSLRQRDYGYSRAGISVEPIVRVEEHLHAIIPSIEILVGKLNRLLKSERPEEA